MHTEEDEVPITSKKKSDNKGQSSDIAGSVDKSESKKTEKVEGDDPKPRIVLTFRSDKKNCNMKIVPNDDKHEEFSPRRSSRTRNKWEWSEDTEMSISPKKDKNSSQSVSENDEASDSSHATSKRSTRRRSKDSTDNVLANAIARKEKSYNEASPGPTQRLSRRIKPTAKILANEELRIGLESQNNARLGLQSDKHEEGVRTRKSARSMQPEVDLTQVTPAMYLLDRNKKDTNASKASEEEEGDDEEEVTEVEESNTEKKQNHNTVMKLKHLCELGLKAINPEAMEDDAVELDDDDEEEDEEYDHDAEELEDDDDDEIDDDSEVISKLLEADEDSDEDFNCAVEAPKTKRPRRSTRLCSSYVEPDNVSLGMMEDEEKLVRNRRENRPSRKRTRIQRIDDDEVEEPDESHRDVSSRRVRSKQESRKRSLDRKHEEDSQSVVELEDDTSEPAGGDEGSEAACPDDEAGATATCFCETPSNVYAAGELPEPVFCQAIELVDGVRVGCSHAAARDRGELRPLLRAGPRAPYALLCAAHAAQHRAHLRCPACGLFCTQGIFYQCSEGHLFHLECGLPYNDVKLRPGCPHCGVCTGKWEPRNKRCHKVQVQMKCSNKRIFLPDQREQCTPAYLSFTTLEPSQTDQSPLIPEDLLPSLPVDLKAIGEASDTEMRDCDELSTSSHAQRLCDAILAGESIQELLPKIAASKTTIDEQLASLTGGTCVHAAVLRGAVGALHAVRLAGASLDAVDNRCRAPLLLAAHLLTEKSDKKNSSKTKKNNKNESKDETEVKEDVDADTQEEVEEIDTNTASLEECKVEKANDEDLIKVVRYLVAAGCDVNIQGSDGMTALHIAAQSGLVQLCQVLLDAASVDVDPRDHGGWTPLVWAAENGHVEVVRLLLSRDADASTRDAEGNGCIHWCALAGHSHVLRLLLERAPHDAAAPNDHRDTPLHVAARQGHYACVVILLAKGARTDMENSAGELPVEVCTGACQSVISLNMQLTQVAKGTISRHKLLSSDLSNGTEMYPLPCVNEVDDEPVPDFTYVTDHVMPEPLDIDNTIQSLQGCSCKEGTCGDGSCACCALSVRRWSERGRLRADFPHHDPPMLFECNATCACNKRKCGNMLITRLQQRGSLFVPAVVFRTRRAGWGLRAAAAVPRGAPLALYCGELLPLRTADARANDQYLFALDVKPDLAQQCGDKPTLCVDACAWGSAARFVNHSCAPNLAPLRVYTRARDLALPCVALFATRPVRAGDELTFDYGDKFWSVKSKFMKCECGSPECRYPVKSTE